MSLQSIQVNTYIQTKHLKDTDRTFAAAIVLLGRNVELTPHQNLFCYCSRVSRLYSLTTQCSYSEQNCHVTLLPAIKISRKWYRSLRHFISVDISLIGHSFDRRYSPGDRKMLSWKQQSNIGFFDLCFWFLVRFLFYLFFFKGSIVVTAF